MNKVFPSVLDIKCMTTHLNETILKKIDAWIKKCQEKYDSYKEKYVKETKDRFKKLLNKFNNELSICVWIGATNGEEYDTEVVIKYDFMLLFDKVIRDIFNYKYTND